MKKYNTLIIFLILTAIWSIFFSTTKFFLWLDLKDTLKIDLQAISGYMSFGSVFSYLIGGALAYTFLKKYFLFAIGFLALIISSIGFYIGFDENLFVGIIISIIGFFYGLWVVVKNIIISIEIEKTGLQDTTVNALVGVIFVVFLILGTFAGSIAFETKGHEGFFVVIFLLFLSSIIALFLDYDEKSLSSLLKHGFHKYYFERKHKFKTSMKDYLPDLIYITKKYFLVIIVSSILWSISTIVSQKAVEFSVDTFDKQASEASFLLLYSAVGIILGNIASMRMEKRRWFYFSIFNVLFGIIIIIFPFVAFSFEWVSYLAFIVGFLFGGASNLIDAFYLRKIGEDNKKEYGASTHGLILSIVIFIMMGFSFFISKFFGFTYMMVILGGIILLSTIFIMEVEED